MQLRPSRPSRVARVQRRRQRTIRRWLTEPTSSVEVPVSTYDAGVGTARTVRTTGERTGAVGAAQPERRRVACWGAGSRPRSVNAVGPLLDAPSVMTGPAPPDPVRRAHQRVREEAVEQRQPPLAPRAAGVRALGEVHQLERDALDPRRRALVDGQRAEQLSALLLLDVVVLPPVGEQHRGAEVVGMATVVAGHPEPVVVRVAVVALLGVRERIALGGAGARGVGEVPEPIGSAATVLPKPTSKRQRGVEALVGRHLGVAGSSARRRRTRSRTSG